MPVHEATRARSSSALTSALHRLRIGDHIGFTGEEPVIVDQTSESVGFAKVRGEVVGSLSNLLGRARPVHREFDPEIAWVEGGEIRIGSYQGRLPA